jgi:hypothetical protein
MNSSEAWKRTWDHWDAICRDFDKLSRADRYEMKVNRLEISVTPGGRVDITGELKELRINGKLVRFNAPKGAA